MHRWWTFAALPLVLCVPTLAAAQEATDLADTSVSGEQLYGDLTISGPVTIRPYDPNEPGTGFAYIRASSIHVTESGSIDASGAGYRGTEAPDAVLNGTNPGTSPPDNGMALPGGGGGHVGAGGPGLALDCTVFTPDIPGGLSNSNSAATFEGILTSPRNGMGSAGGSSWAGPINPGVRIPGSSGGGTVILEAARIQLDGRIDASADSVAAQLLGAGPGGGAGGTVILRTNDLTVGPTAGIAARGANGGQASNSETLGGGGSGGLVVLSAEGDFSSFLTDRVSVTGGTVADFSACGGSDPAPGEDGEKQRVDPPDCIDADRDGAPNALCEGTDCDDGNAAVGPDASESCNGVDDDCDESVDEEDEGPLCPLGSGQVCSNGTCTVGQGGGGPVAPPVDVQAPEVELGGGLCSAPGPRPGGPPWGGWALAALGVAVTASRRWSRR